MAIEKIATGLRSVTMKINGHWGAVDVYLDTEKDKVVAVEQGKKCEGVYLSTFKAQRFNINHHYTMQEVSGFLQTGLIACGHAEYKIQ